jgi:GNAT superfamily N-acetyltransferase
VTTRSSAASRTFRRSRSAVDLRVEPLRDDQLNVVCQELWERPRALHRERLEEQSRSGDLYLIAWREDVPVGHVILAGPDSPNASEFARRFRCAEVMDLAVMPEHRNRGVATALMNECETRTRGLGIGCIGLGTGLDTGYAPARELYRRVGFREVEGSFYIQSSRIATDSGGPAAWFEALTYWTKELGAPQDVGE